MKVKRLLVVGELNVDLILNGIHGLPKVGEEILAERFHLTLGSSSAIFASNISVLGADTSFCGMIGEDDFGDFVEEKLKEKGVSTTFLRKVKDRQTGMTVVLNYGQDRANITYCGAMDALTLEDIPWESIDQFDHLHFSNLFLQHNIQKDIVRLFRKAKEAGLTTSLDLQTDPEGNFDFDYKAALPHVDVFLPNKAELLGVTKVATVGEALEMLRPYAKTIALKMGEEGSILFENGVKTTAVAFKHERFVDAIGAGDSFNAGFIYQFLKGKSLKECLEFGNLTGAINTTAPGGTGAFGSKEQVSEIVEATFNQEID